MKNKNQEKFLSGMHENASCQVAIAFSFASDWWRRWLSLDFSMIF